MGHWVTIDGRHVLIEDDGGHSGQHNPATETGSKTVDHAIGKRYQVQKSGIYTTKGGRKIRTVIMTDKENPAKPFGVYQLKGNYDRTIGDTRKTWQPIAKNLSQPEAENIFEKKLGKIAAAAAQVRS